MDALSKLPSEMKINTPKLKKVGLLKDMQKLSRGTHQFLSGVFVAFIGDSEVEATEIELYTEDSEFRMINLTDVYVEVRLFDTSYFEIYLNDQGLLEKLKKTLRVEDKDIKTSQVG